MLNQIVIMGRLTKTPELRYTQSKKPVTSFTLAVERDFTGEKKETDFIDCVSWNRAAEVIAEHFDKGQMMAVTGRLQFRDWEDRDGNKRRSAEILVDSFYFCDSKKKADSKPTFVELTDEEELPY